MDPPVYYVAEEKLMIIRDVRINGIPDPIGYDLSMGAVCSWKVEEARDPLAVKSRITVFGDEGKTRRQTCLEGKLDSTGTALRLPLFPRKRYWFTVEVYSENEYAASDLHFFETGKGSEPWEAAWIGTAEEKDERHPIFFRRFSLPAGVRSARLYVTGLGLYEAYLNGKKTGEDELTPHCTDYGTRIQADTYDVTGLLSEDNLLEIHCGNGWYKGRLGYEGGKALFGDRFGCAAELRAETADGREVCLFTDGGWQYRFSAVQESDLYDGEFRDDTAETGESRNVQVLPFDFSLLKDRLSLPVRVKQTLPVKEVIRNDAGETILDFGQNFAGFVAFTNRLQKGEELLLEFGEILQKGRFYNGNYRTAKARFRYRSDGMKKTVRPHFTFYGFRYVRVTGITNPDPRDFTGCAIYSDLTENLRFSSSSPDLNRLQLNTLWGQRSNFIDIPTDCPQRDERLGWTGDANVFSPTACFQMDTRAFYHKYLTDLRDDQVKHGGAVANYVPNITGAGGSSVWGDAAIAIPMNLYETYGDAEALRSHYPLMKEWMEYIIEADRKSGNRHLWDTGFHFGDWLALDGISEQSFKGGTEDAFIASVCYYMDCGQMKKAAEILSCEADRERYEKQETLVRDAILKEYFTPNGRLAIDTQTGYLLALSAGLGSSEDVLIRGLLDRFRRDAYRIRCGFVGATRMLQTLAAHGLEDLAVWFLFQEEYPGWMHCVHLGATTIWERWNSVLDDGSISGTGMNSLNHYAYGSVMEYVYRYLAGIAPLAPGYRKALIAPRPNWRLRELSVEYDSACGIYRSATRLGKDGTLDFRFSIPFGASALVRFPGTEREEEFKAGDYEFRYMPEKDYLQKYHEDSLMAEILPDEEALRILRRHLPMINPGEEETRSIRLGDLRGMFYLGISPEQAEACVQELMRMRA